MAGIANRAKQEARAHLFLLGARWLHVQAVAARAAELAQSVPAPDRSLLIAAAWLHDIGYAPDIVATDFHALDGARFLRNEGWDARVCVLVAHHSCARFEAEERGIESALEAWPCEEGTIA